jgi:hypothetical protein
MNRKLTKNRPKVTVPNAKVTLRVRQAASIKGPKAAVPPKRIGESKQRLKATRISRNTSKRV